MADDARLAELRGLMAEALGPHLPHTIGCRAHRESAPGNRCVCVSGRTGRIVRIAAALLPVVSAWAEADREREAARRAAEALNDAADAARHGFINGRNDEGDQWARWLRARAAALTAATEEQS